MDTHDGSRREGYDTSSAPWFIQDYMPWRSNRDIDDASAAEEHHLSPKTDADVVEVIKSVDRILCHEVTKSIFKKITGKDLLLTKEATT